MEVLQAVRFPDGRILLLAAGLRKFKVVNPLQVVPYSRADVLVIPDAEELQAFEGEQANVDNSSSYPAAIAAAGVWQQYEASRARVHESVALIDGDDEDAAMAFGRRLVSIGSNELLELPYSFKSKDTSRATAEKLEGATLRDTILTAAAAADSVSRVTDYSDEIQQLFCTYVEAAINSVEERGGAPLPDTSVEDTASFDSPNLTSDDEERASSIISLESALALEERVWEELDILRDLAQKISGNGAVYPLPRGLASLRPMVHDLKSGQSVGACAWDGKVAHPEYPALRRTQRLSYALASRLGSVANSEGRQAWLEAPSVTSRLRKGVSGLVAHRSVLAAVVAVQSLDSTPRDDGP